MILACSNARVLHGHCRASRLDTMEAKTRAEVIVRQNEESIHENSAMWSAYERGVVFIFC
ncbi:hypothetical protein SCLCIDRAFT_1218916 [Scleroderma citrinum Foug A]|uniref:Uncharacterized protein n=1 Tax=Scleroderma citrinum Foug A TaxID=1036808 RepID=A0A0C3DB78_9AGAM|nr:hypothetical protein SCLCIDRAFT_1218916 [Scleroderma citrinum Foug A]